MEKVALIELAENSTKLSIYMTQNGRSKLIRTESDKANISKDIEEEKLLRPKTISDTVNILKIYRNIIEENDVKKIIAVANDILMQARNQRGFFEEIYNNTGMSFTFVTEEDFVKNIYTSSCNKIDSSKGTIVYVGSHSTYLIKYNRRTTLGYDCIPVGYETITKLGSDFDSMKSAFAEKLVLKNVSLDDEEFVLGEGVPFVNLGRIAKKIDHYPIEIDNNYPVSHSLEKKVVEFVKGLDLEKVTKVKGLVEDRTDILISGLAIVSAVYDKLKIKETTIATASVRDGIITNSFAADIQERFSDLLASSFDSIHEFIKDDNSVNIRVANMAGILFKQLKVMHKLPRAYVKPMRVAAYMFDSGKQISFDDYEKHGFYAILNSGLCGVSQKDLLLGAFICQCQTADNFNLSQWMKYKDILNDEDLNAVRKLGVIVKLAVALNSSKQPVVTDIVCDILGDSIIMKTIVNSDPSYEIMQGMKVARDYRKYFKKNLQII